MADLFDALAARALGVDPGLAPALAPRFGPTADEPEHDPDGLPGPTWVVPPATAQPAVPLPEPAATRSPPEGRRAHAEPASAAPASASASASASGEQTLKHSDEGTGRERPAPVELAPERQVPPSPARRREPPGGQPERERPPEGHHQESEPARARIVFAPTERLAEPAARIDAVPERPARGHQARPAPVQVTVSIGRVEIRAPAPPPAPGPPPQPRPPEPRLSLQEYLRRDGRR
jgi:hypothetical protein